ncbi:MAG: Kazal-type serine protease inhibitor [Candidatus Paceibacterota bacterium]
MKFKKYFPIIVLFLFFISSKCFASSPVFLTYPQGGETFLKDKDYSLTWDFEKQLKGNIKIDLVFNSSEKALKNCNLGIVSIQNKKLIFNFSNLSKCADILTDKASYYFHLYSPVYYVDTGYYVDLDIKSNKFTIRFNSDNICGSAIGKSFSILPTEELCNYGNLTSIVSAYNQQNINDGQWHWKCNDVFCSANDPNQKLKIKFKATEIINFIGDSADPDSLEYWAEGVCALFSLPARYELVSCEDKFLGNLEKHGGKIDSLMMKVKTKKPILCAQVYLPVCGRDGKTYLNDCYAQREGVEILHNGGCSLKIDGVCGSADKKSFSEKPSINLCRSGIASTVSKYSPWTWTCDGLNGGITVKCSAQGIISKKSEQDSSITNLSKLSRAELLEILFELLASRK